ncbi:MAG: hypothetical protein Q8L60_11980 [Gammaproteobacteria bacterium]|nr:hypothetical protein [Gammaproteobacteria bacterium]MDP2347664.1 hypothetical protein [Gammaproteobacteria bacterium]
MKLLNFAFSFGLTLLSLPAWSQQSVVPLMVQEISMTGEQYKLVSAAVAEFQNKGLRIDGYAITLFKSGENFVVLFNDPERSATQLGSTNRMISFSVNLNREGEVLSSQGER